MNTTHSALKGRTSELIRRFNQAFLSHDPSALPGLAAEDCVIENIPAGAQRRAKIGPRGLRRAMEPTRIGAGHAVRYRRGLRRRRARDHPMALLVG